MNKSLSFFAKYLENPAIIILCSVFIFSTFLSATLLLVHFTSESKEVELLKAQITDLYDQIYETEDDLESNKKELQKLDEEYKDLETKILNFWKSRIN